jgi:phosphatidylinositol alpha-1,6-mannosyltransferase
MKRTLLVTLDFPPMFGGVANYWANLSRFFPSDQFVVLAPECDDSLDFDIKQNYLIYRKNLISKDNWLWPKWLPLFYQALILVRREKIKKIIVGHILPTGTVALLLFKFLRISYVISIHGLDINLTQASRRKRWLTKTIVQNAETVIANSNFTKELLVKLGYCESEKIEIIYPCPNISYEQREENFVLEIKSKYKLEDKKIILTVGRLVERKGHDRVIQSLPKVLEKIPNAIYLVVGAGANLKYLKELVVLLKIEDHVLFFTDIADSELPGFYQLADVFIMPSRKLAGGDIEGFGIVYLEANGFGKPVIAGRAGGAVEAVEDGINGLVVDPESITEIADALIKILKDKALATKFGEAGKLRIAKKFNWFEQAKRLINLLN